MSATRADPAGDGAKPRGAPAGVTQQIGEEVKAEARQLRDDLIGGARRQGEQKKDATGAYLHTVASAVCRGAEAFRRDGRDGTGALLERAADEIVHVADRLEHRAAGEILRDVEGFARRHPAVFFGSAFVLAFGAARLLKSSAPAGQPDRIPAPASGDAASAGTSPAGTTLATGSTRASAIPGDAAMDADAGPTGIGMPPGASAGVSATGEPAPERSSSKEEAR